MSEKVWGAEGKSWGVLRMPYNLAGDGSHSDAGTMTYQRLRSSSIWFDCLTLDTVDTTDNGPGTIDSLKKLLPAEPLLCHVHCPCPCPLLQPDLLEA